MILVLMIPGRKPSEYVAKIIQPSIGRQVSVALGALMSDALMRSKVGSAFELTPALPNGQLVFHLRDAQPELDLPLITQTVADFAVNGLLPIA